MFKDFYMYLIVLLGVVSFPGLLVTLLITYLGATQLFAKKSYLVRLLGYGFIPLSFVGYSNLTTSIFNRLALQTSPQTNALGIYVITMLISLIPCAIYLNAKAKAKYSTQNNY